MFDVKAWAENHLGGPILPGEYEAAERSARRKLDWITSRYGYEGHGDEYLAVLVSEYVDLHRFQNYLEARQIEREITKQANGPICQKCGKCGQKEKAATKATNSYNTNPILPRIGQIVNMTEVLL